MALLPQIQIPQAAPQLAPNPAVTAAAAAAAAAVQMPGAGVTSPMSLLTPEERMRQAQAWVLQQQQVAGLAPRPPAANKKNREVYVGNLAVGVVTADLLTTFFNTALRAAFPQVAGDPVMAVQQAMDGKYAFVELRTEEMASAAITLHGMELVGRAMTVARPSGYVDPLTAQQVAAQAAAVVAVQASILIGGAAPTAGAGSAGSAAAEAAAAAGVDAAPSVFLSLHNLVTEADLWSDQDYEDIQLDLREEAGKYGTVAELVVPRGSATQGSIGMAYVKFATVDEATAAKKAMDGRLFDGRTIRCFFITEETFAALHRDSANAAAADAAGGVSSAGGEGQEVVDGAGGEEEPRSLGEGAGGASGALPAAGQQEAQGEDAAAGTGLREDLQRADAAAAAAAGAPPAAEPEEGGEN